MFENACNKYALMIIYRYKGKVLKKGKGNGKNNQDSTS